MGTFYVGYVGLIFSIVCANKSFNLLKYYICGCVCLGKTRTSDKYRVVYTDLQKVELEKEFLYSKYITIQRKAELARFVNLSERQVKIWFQNRRAKERKSKKHDDVMPASPLGNAHDDADSPSPDHVTEYVLPMKKCSQDDVMLSAAHRLRPDVNHHLFSSYIHGH